MCLHTFVPEETRIVPQVSGMKTVVDLYRCPKCGKTKQREDLNDE